MIRKFDRIFGIVTGTVGLLIAVTGAVLARLEQDK